MVSIVRAAVSRWVNDAELTAGGRALPSSATRPPVCYFIRWAAASAAARKATPCSTKWTLTINVTTNQANSVCALLTSLPRGPSGRLGPVGARLANEIGSKYRKYKYTVPPSAAATAAVGLR